MWNKAYKKFILSSLNRIFGLEECESYQQTNNMISIKYHYQAIEGNSPANNVENQLGDEVGWVPVVIPSTAFQ